MCAPRDTVNAKTLRRFLFVFIFLKGIARPDILLLKLVPDVRNVHPPSRNMLSSRASCHRSARASSATGVVFYAKHVAWKRRERLLHLVMARVPEADRRLIIELFQKGHSQRAIGALVNRPLKTVNRIVQAFRYEGRIHDAPRGTPPRATTEDEDRYIIAAVVEDPFFLGQGNPRGAGIGRSALRWDMRRGRRMTGAGSSFQTNRRSPPGKTNACVCGDPAAHCKACLERSWRVASSGRTSVNVWGAISKHGLGPLHRIVGRLTSTSYCDVVDTVLIPFVRSGLFPDGNFLFQQDLAPIHTARTVKDHLRQCGIKELPWVPKGADLNIIENVWGRMKAAMQTTGVADDTRSRRLA
ncbi:hypothetical protein HPB47_015899 [Ixodes persulcatus]|uniref:Uncharacterized protein n=1 Tax=Ixodes persulcatus TaxID=34615 RepID=A0AC60QS97_IXOPE|nr:hypothetical protein HPB47_015899 [Ixodes persulcatus]